MKKYTFVLKKNVSLHHKQTQKKQKKMKKMKAKETKKYNYFYYGMPICEADFKKNVPWNWEAWVFNGNFSWGGYDAVEIDEDEE